MAVIKHIEDLVERAIARLLGQYKDLLDWDSMIDVLVSEVQEAEDVCYDLIVLRTLDKAEGVNLDQYGAIVTEARGRLSDADYRRVIRAKILVNTSRGQGDLLLEVVSRVTSSSDVRLTEAFPAGLCLYYVDHVGLSDDLRARAYRMTTQAKGGGVNLIWLVEAPSTYFGFEDDPSASGFDIGVWAEVVGT